MNSDESILLNVLGYGGYRLSERVRAAGRPQHDVVATCLHRCNVR